MPTRAILWGWNSLMTRSLIFLGLAAAVVSGLAVTMRMIPMPAKVWHVDPADVTPPSTPNYVLMRGEGARIRKGNVTDVSTIIDRTARSEGAQLIGGSVEKGHMTYVARTRIMGFPDAVSIKVTPAGDGQVRIEVFSRSRFGYSDMGVNNARVARWLERLSP
jgi:hypothetical protein